jgi:hypothetical protein
LLAETDVFRHRQIKEELQFLMNHPYSQLLRDMRIGNPCFLALDKDPSALGLHGTIQNVHERAFSRAVLTHQTVHLAGAALEIDMIEGDRAREFFRHAVNTENFSLFQEIHPQGYNRGDFPWRSPHASTVLPAES